ncbi:MAG: ATP-binding protein [Aestuariivita sp.]|nr:ATP-binding protein [Aestuariivita sp.]MCY4202753.1 ATP-binding protein [Aestuariivita sp.]
MADIQGLQKFSELQERDEAMFFAGRAAYITHIQQACKDAVTKQQANQPITSATRLFYGAPGAGKTSLLHEIEKRAVNGDLGTIQPIIVTLPSCHLLKSEEGIVLHIAKKFEKDAVFRTTATSETAFTAGILDLLKGMARREHIQNPPRATFDNLEDIYRRGNLQRPILLCVDEIQNIKPAADEMLGLLHQGNHGLPIIPVYAGLGNSLNMLMNHGVSRPVSGYIHSVGALANDEAQECVSSMLKAFNVDCTGVKEDWPAILAECSDCWPQHLHNGMRALAKELIRPDVNGVLRCVSLTNVSDTERAFRNKAYSWRISEVLARTKRLAGCVMQQVTARSCDFDGVESIVLTLDQQAPQDPKQKSASLPEDMSATDYVNHMIHYGLLQEFTSGETNNVVTCPIPSLATYVMQRGGIDPEPQKDLQSSDLLAPSSV